MWEAEGIKYPTRENRGDKTEDGYFRMLGRVKCFGGWDDTFKQNGRKPLWREITDDELKMAIDQPFYDPAEEAKDRGWGEPCAWCFDFKSLSPFKNGITDRDRARRKLQHRLKMKAAEIERMTLVVSNKGFKPCRMRACNGRAHKAHIDPATGKPEKCPVMSGLGKKGGKSGTGANKARNGDKNGRSKGGKRARTQTAARLKAGDITIQTGPVETTDPFAYYQHKINRVA